MSQNTKCKSSKDSNTLHDNTFVAALLNCRYIKDYDSTVTLEELFKDISLKENDNIGNVKKRIKYQIEKYFPDDKKTEYEFLPDLFIYRKSDKSGVFRYGIRSKNGTYERFNDNNTAVHKNLVLARIIKGISFDADTINKLDIIQRYICQRGKDNYVGAAIPFTFSGNEKKYLKSSHYIVPMKVIVDNGLFVEGLIFRCDSKKLKPEKGKDKMEIDLDKKDNTPIRLNIDRINIEENPEPIPALLTTNIAESITLNVRKKCIPEIAAYFSGHDISFYNNKSCNNTDDKDTEQDDEKAHRNTIVEAKICNVSPMKVRKWICDNPDKAEITEPLHIAELSRKDIDNIRRNLSKRIK